jgi:hypothetical protein
MDSSQHGIVISDFGIFRLKVIGDDGDVLDGEHHSRCEVFALGNER